MTMSTNMSRSRDWIDYAEMAAALLPAAAAPGFVIGLICLPVAPLMIIPMTIFGLVIGLPFAFCVFAPLAFVYSRFLRLSWLSCTALGFCTVFFVGILYGPAGQEASRQILGAALFAFCGAIGGSTFWWCAREALSNEPNTR